MVRARDVKKPVEPEAPPLALAVRRGSALEVASVLFSARRDRASAPGRRSGWPFRCSRVFDIVQIRGINVALGWLCCALYSIAHNTEAGQKWGSRSPTGAAP